MKGRTGGVAASTSVSTIDAFAAFAWQQDDDEGRKPHEMTL
jgi:hypothetical protein